MNKAVKIAGIALGALAGVIVTGVAVLVLTAPEDIVLTPAQEQEENRRIAGRFSGVEIGGFSARSIDGKTVTSDIFRDYDITMVNIWTTTCGPCIEEMPGIAGLFRDRPQGSNIISICVDAGDRPGRLRAARKIMDKSGAEFVTLVPDSVLKRKLTDKADVFPTTVFVDSRGAAVGAPHSGGRDAEDYRRSIRERQEQLTVK